MCRYFFIIVCLWFTRPFADDDDDIYDDVVTRRGTVDVRKTMQSVIDRTTRMNLDETSELVKTLSNMSQLPLAKRLWSECARVSFLHHL